ncbi:hypothetical protein Athai_66550 [Actinocatenispora thailandica]|uniref:Uncharacterized protein n=2 Tax=Actinocatenispora thailandica TaxID=227318 RepID=A0A7R7DXE4_9ACTN|nr:hypothetical protein Athai_66550 [Actinocatenispora thailandica]
MRIDPDGYDAGMQTLNVVLLIASVLFLVLGGISYSHRRTRKVRWEWLGIACLVATMLVTKLAALF